MTKVEKPALPATRAEAFALGVTQYSTGEPCNRGHVAPRWRSGGACVECDRAFQKTEAQRAWKRAYDMARNIERRAHHQSKSTGRAE